MWRKLTTANVKLHTPLCCSKILIMLDHENLDVVLSGNLSADKPVWRLTL